MTAKEVTLKDIATYFGYPLGEFAKQWRRLTDQDKVELKAGLTDGTLTY